MGYSIKNYREQGGAKWVVGGELAVGSVEVSEAPAAFTFTPDDGSANVSEVKIQAVDAHGTAVAKALLAVVWLSDAATGAGLTGTTASGTVQAKSGEGTDVNTLSAKKAILVQTKVDGSYTLEITDDAKTDFYVCAQSVGGFAHSVSAQLETGDYGT